MIFDPLILPIKTISEANTRQHYMARHRRAQAQKGTAYLLTKPARFAPLKKFPATVTLTRVAPRRLDSDNLTSSMKACRDGIALALGIDDGDERVTWNYDQRKGAPGEYAVEIKVTHGDG